METFDIQVVSYDGSPAASSQASQGYTQLHHLRQSWNCESEGQRIAGAFDGISHSSVVPALGILCTEVRRVIRVPQSNPIFRCFMVGMQGRVDRM